MQSAIIQKYVREYIEEISTPFWVDDIAKYLKSKLGISVQLHQLRNFMKKKLWLAYKKGASRPSNLNKKIVGSLKCLFWIRLVKNLSTIKTIINIDESCLNKNTMVNYSWLTKGKKCPLANIKYKNSVSMISAICSNGFSMTVCVYKTTKGSTFLQFLKALESKLDSCCWLKLCKCLIILDNCSVHRTKEVKEYFNNTHSKVHYNVPYWPELAPI